MSAVEEAAELVEDVVEAVPTEWIGEFTRRELLGQYAFVGGCVAVIAGSAGYFLAKRHLQTKYERIIENEVNKTREYYKNVLATKQKVAGSTAQKFINDAEEDAQMQAAVDKKKSDALAAMAQYRPEQEPELEETIVVEEDEEVTVVLQEERDDGWDLEAEVANRDPDEPYVISFDEFMTNDPEHNQNTFTYYQGDDVLSDERDQAIPYVDPVVGSENLKRFGDGSGDPRVVHVRNERLGTDYEIVLSDGKYAHEVLGLQHSDGGNRGRQQDNRVRKFRGDRE
jgi:hypothetical protein